MAVTADILRTKFGFNDPNVISGILNDPAQVARYDKEMGGGATGGTLDSTNIGSYLDAYQKEVAGLFGTGSGVATRGGSFTPGDSLVGLSPAEIAKNFGGTGSAYAALLGIGENDKIAAGQSFNVNLSDTGSGEVQFLTKNLTSTGGSAAAQTPFEQIKSNLTGGLTAPTPINRVQMFQDLSKAYGVDELTTQVNDLKATQREMDAQLRVNVAAERGKPVAQNVIQGRVSEQQRNAQENYDFVSRQIAYKTDQLNSAYNVIGMYVNYAGMDYQDAATRYKDEFQQSLDVINLMRGIKQDALTEQQRNIDNARANLQVMTNAITSGNLTYDQLSPEQKTQISKLEAQSGLPVGFTSSLGLSAKDKILFTNTNNGVTQVGIMGADGKVTVQSYGKPQGTVSGTKTATENYYNNLLLDDIKSGTSLETLLQIYSGKVDPNTIYERYNVNSPHGASDTKYWTPERLAQMGIKTIANKEPASGTQY